MNIDNILKVVGNILLKMRGINPRALASLSEESDFYFQLGLQSNEIEKTIAGIEQYYKVDMGEAALQNANMKFWVDTILNFEERRDESEVIEVIEGDEPEGRIAA